jgi:hypothetical protein
MSVKTRLADLVSGAAVHYGRIIQRTDDYFVHWRQSDPTPYREPPGSGMKVIDIWDLMLWILIAL